MLGMTGPIDELRDQLSLVSHSIIEDACESVGAKVGNRYSGTLGDIGVFSFDHGKNMTCGEGGLTLTNSLSLYNYISSYSDHGHALARMSLEVGHGYYAWF